LRAGERLVVVGEPVAVDVVVARVADHVLVEVLLTDVLYRATVVDIVVDGVVVAVGVAIVRQQVAIGVLGERGEVVITRFVGVGDAVLVGVELEGVDRGVAVAVERVAELGDVDGVEITRDLLEV